MPIATNLVATIKNGNKTKTQNIPYANPDATDENLAKFAAAFFGLSQNSLVNVSRVDKHDLAAISKPTPTITVTYNSETVGDSFEAEATGGGGTFDYFTITRDGTGTISVESSDSINSIEVSYDSNGMTVGYGKHADSQEATATITITVAEDGNYAAATKSFELTLKPAQIAGPPMP